MVIGLAGAARSGKDTFYRLLSDELQGRANCKRLAFADELKEDLKPLLMGKFNIDPTDTTEHEKNLIRPLLVAYGTDLARNIDKKYWIKKISKKIKLNNKTVFVITDVRYPNESEWVKSFSDSVMVYIERDGISPANQEESKNCPILKSNSDYVISWPTYSNEQANKRLNFVKSFINEKVQI